LTPLSCMQINWSSKCSVGRFSLVGWKLVPGFSAVLSENRHENLLDGSHSFEKGPVLMVKSF
jgi:hypothetical protein